ncbi:MAG: PulJ/GspJ family protein [Candidatus Saccharimonadales bacterium]
MRSVTSHSFSHRTQAADGFTLVELVIVIALTGILATVAAIFIRAPVEGYISTANRAALVASAQAALNQMSDDIRNALPNSVRVSGTALELLHVADGTRYRDGNAPGAGGADIRLKFNQADTDFNVMQPFTTSATGDWLSIYPTTTTTGSGASPYDVGMSPAVITPTGTSITIGAAGNGSQVSEYHVALSPGYKFLYSSPNKRIYLVDKAVSYICSGSNLTRYSGYTFGTAQPNPPAGGTNALEVDDISACAITYTAGTPTRRGLVTINLSLTRNGETITLLSQVHVVNSP